MTVPIPTDWPTVYPGGWERMPLDVRRYLTQRLLDKMRAVFDGPDKGGTAELIRFMYAGVPREGLLPSQTYQMTGQQFYPYVVQDAAVWAAHRREPAQ